MVQIVEHRAETSTDFLVEEKVVSSTPQVPNRPVPGTAVVHAARHHTTAQTFRTPSRAALGALSAARELLRHPPSSTTSPGAMKQWWDDVDRLLGMAHSTSTRSRPRSSRRQHEASASVRSPSVRVKRPTTSGQNSTAGVRERTPGSLWRGARAPPKHRGSQPRSRLRCGSAAGPNGHPVPSGCPLGRRGLRRSHGSSPRGVMATQVPAAPAGKVRRNVKPVGVPAGVCHRYHSSRWKHRCDGNIFSCRLVWTCPDLAHEPHPRVNLLLGRALRVVRCELRQRLPATRCGGPPPCSKAGARGNSPDVHIPLHQGMGHVKSLHRDVLSATPGVLKAAPHQRWRSTTISFGASDCPDNMAGAGILPLITAPVIANMQLHHVLIDDGAGLNVISHVAFKQLQIPGSRLGPSRHSPEWAHSRCIPLGASHSQLHSGLRRTSARRTSCSTLQKSTSPLTPSLAGRPCTGSWPLPITGIWSLRCHPRLGSSPCRVTVPPHLRP
jgi:hypothetical protein